MCYGMVFFLVNSENLFQTPPPFYERGFLVSNASMIVMHDIHSTSGIPNKYLKVNIPSSIIETFAVDAKSDIIYFVDSESTSLKKYHIITQRTSTLASISSARGNI